MRKRALGYKIFSFLLAFLLVFSEAGNGLSVFAQGEDESGAELPISDTEEPVAEEGNAEQSGADVSENEAGAEQPQTDVSENEAPEPNDDSVTNYGIWVGGTEITSENKDRIPNLEGKNATGTFDPEKRVLTLHNVSGIKGYDAEHKAKILTSGKTVIQGDGKIENTEGPVIYGTDMNSADNLVLTGEFELKGRLTSVIYSEANVVLNGRDSKIDIVADSTYCVATEKGFVSILDGHYSLKGDGGISAHGGKINLTGDIDIDVNRYRTALASWGAKGDIYIGELYTITYPLKAEIRILNIGENNSRVTVVDPDSGDELTKLHIGLKPKNYGLWIGDVEINAINKDDLPNLVGGTGSYNPNTHTLTLNGVTDITGRYNDTMITSEMGGTLTIEGSATLVNDGCVISSNSDLILKGDLNLHSGLNNTIIAHNSSITIDGNLTASTDAIGYYALRAYDSEIGVRFLSGRTNITGIDGIYTNRNVIFDGGELNLDVEYSSFTLLKSADIIVADGYGFLEPEGAHVGRNPFAYISDTVLDANGNEARKVRMGLKSDIGLFIGFDTTDSTLTKNASGKYTAVYTGAAVKPEVLVKNNGKVLIEGVDYKLRYSKNTKVGTATVTVTGKGSYSKKRTLSFDIVQKDLADHDVVIGNLSYQKGKKPAPIAAYYGSVLKAKKDYDLEVNGSLVTIRGKGNFTGSVTVNVVEQEADAYKNATIKVKFEYEELAYNGSKREPSFVDLDVKSSDGTSLKSRTDFDVSYSDTVNAGIVKFVVVSKGSRNGIYKKTYRIFPDKYSAINVSGLKDSYPYSKYGVKPSIVVKSDSRVLKEGRDYSITYKSNKKPGTGSISLKFLGNYKGAIYDGEKNFKIDVANPDPSDVNVIVGDMIFTKPGKYQPVVWASVYGQLLGRKELNTEYSNNDKLTEAKTGLTLNAQGTRNYNFSKWASYNVLPAGSATDVSKAKVTLVQDGKTVKKVAYTGKEITFSSGNATAPRLSVKLKNGTVLTGAEVEANFDICYADNIEKGTATLILKAKTGSGYAGVCTGKFKITAMSFGQR